MMQMASNLEYSPKLLVDHRSFLYAAIKDWYQPIDWNDSIETQISGCIEEDTAFILVLKHDDMAARKRLLAMYSMGIPIVPVTIRSMSKLKQKTLNMMQFPGLTKPRPTSVIRLGRAYKPEVHQSDKELQVELNMLFERMRAMNSATEIKGVEEQEKEIYKKEIAIPVQEKTLVKEIKDLDRENGFLFQQQEFRVYIASAWQIPNMMQEIGRMREITFRQVEEGTGQAQDIDQYDLYYKQLIIWDAEAKKLVGGYRLGPGDEIMESYGKKGFYLHSLFKIKNSFKPYLEQSLELGRSYVVPEYQRKRLPLFLLWKGILHFLLDNPQYKYLIGPLSISKHYSKVSRHLIVEFVKKYYFDTELGSMIKARKQFRFNPKNIDTQLLVENFAGQLKRLDNFIEDIEPEHFRIPVLMKKYFGQNAQIIGFNLDPNFSDVLDGLMLLDLENLPRETMENLKD